MEGPKRRESKKEAVRKPVRHGGAQGFTHAMLVALLAAINAPANADAQQMQPGTKRAIERLDEDVHSKARVQGVNAVGRSPQEWIKEFRKHSVDHFKKYPQAFDVITGPQFKSMLDEMATINAETVKGTRYEFKGVPTGEMVLMGENGEHGNGIALRFFQKNPDGPGLYERYVIVTARHVAEFAPSPNRKKWTHHPSADLSVVELTKEQAEPYSPLFIRRTDTEAGLHISGEVISILGTDNGRGMMNLPAVLSPRITQHLHEIARMGIPLDWKGESDISQIPKLRFVVIPLGEIEPDLTQDTNGNGVIDEGEQRFLWIQGLSGSPVVYIPERAQGVELCGFLVAAGRVIVEGKSYAFGYVLDDQQMWEAIHVLPGLENQENAERPQKGAPDEFVTSVTDLR